MARNVKTTKASNNLPSHNLVLQVTLADGSKRVVGKIGLFSDNNKLHEQLSQLSPERLQAMLAKCSASVETYGSEASNQEIDLGF